MYPSVCLLKFLFMVAEHVCDKHNVFLFVFQEFQKRLSKAKRIVVVGNGGIALELV